jgi:FkbM family methyltransferase
MSFRLYNLTMQLDTLKRAADLALSHPRLFLRKLGARCVPLPARPIKRKLHGVIFEFDLSESWAGRDIARQMFFRMYEESTVVTMKLFLREGGVFIDVGANVGYLSAVALGLVGRTGQVHSFEPVPEYFSRLEKLGRENPGYQFFANRVALSQIESRATIAVASQNIGWNTMVPGFMPKADEAESVEVGTERLDVFIRRHCIRQISLIKIDTEGFELPVLRGLENYLEQGERPPIICEVAPHAYPLLNSTLADLRSYMLRFGYQSRRLSRTGPGEPVDIRALSGTTDVIWTA